MHVRSRSRSMPMPRGRRPSNAALTRLGARKASEMAILTCRTLHFSRVQSSATVVTRPETTSASSLCIQKFRSWRLEFRGGTGQPALGNRLPRAELRPVFRTYCGFNPRVSNCRLHSAGASRSRSTPMPRGKRPSTAALTRSGARNASEMVILT